MATSIPISGLNALSVVTSSDFIPIVQSSSMTTFRVPILAFGEWISDNVTVSSSLSSSWASSSISSSYAESASYSFVTDNLNYPNTSTSSYAESASYSHKTTSASYADFANSASYSFTSTSASFAITASWAPTPISTSWASRSFSATSSSFADRTISASYALSASYAFTSSNANTASYVSVDIIGPKFIVPVTVVNLNAPHANVNWTTFTAGGVGGVPLGTKAVILQAVIYGQNILNRWDVFIRPDPGFSPEYYRLISCWSDALGRDGASGQGVFPLNAAGEFQYYIQNFAFTSGVVFVEMIGYY